jgi:membrane protease YdiL (CAAX protease family)
VIGPILVIVSWLLLRLERRGLDALGIDQPRRRLGEFALGFLALGFTAAVQQMGLSLAADDPYVVNATLQPASLLTNLRFTINSVLFEELVFRGYLLYRAVRWLGPTRAALLDAAAFGVYHWFSLGVIGNPLVMAYVFVFTGMFGYMWARAFVATGSVVAPIGLHFGWNAVSYLVFSAGPLGAGLLVPASGASRIEGPAWGNLAFQAGLPVLATIVVLRYLHRLEARRRRATIAPRAHEASPLAS